MAFVQATPVNLIDSGVGTAPTLVFGSNVTSGDEIIVAVSSPSAAGPPSSVTDSQGNSYTKQLDYSGALTGEEVTIWTASAGSTAACTVTVHYSSAPSFFSGVAAEYSNINSGTIDQSATVDRSGGLTQTVGPTGTTAQAVELLFAIIAGNSGGSSPQYTAGSGYTLRASGNDATRALAIEDQSVSSTGTYSASFGVPGGWSNSLAIVTFKAGTAPVTQNESHNADLFSAALNSRTHSADLYMPTGTESHNADLFVLVPPSVSESHNADVFVFVAQRAHNADLFVFNPGITVTLQFVQVAGTILFKINPNAFIKVAGTVLQPVRQFIQVLGTIASAGNRNFLNVAGRILVNTRNFLKVAGTISSDKKPGFSADLAVATTNNRQFIQVAGTLVGQPLVGPCGGFPDATYVKVAGWIIEPGGTDSIQMPNQGFTRDFDWNSSSDALARYKPGSVFTIFGGTLPTAGISLLVTAFTSGVASFQTRTRTWLRRVDAAPSGILLTTRTNTHTLPNGAVITTTTTVTQNQDVTTTSTVIQNSATPTRTSTIITEKTASGQTKTREIDTTVTNGIINSLIKKSIFTKPPTSDNIQPLTVRTLDGVIHYQFFTQANQEWAGGDQEGLTTTQKKVQIVPGSLNGQTTDQFGNLIYNQMTDETETDPTGKVIQTHTEEIGTRRDVGTTTTDTASSFNGIQTTVVKTTNYPDGSQTVSTTVTNSLTGDSVETSVETVTDEYGQVTVTTTNTETKTFTDPVTGVLRQQITKTVQVNKGGVTTFDNVVETTNDFEDDIVNQKVKVYWIQEFTLTCVIDEFSMEALSEVNLTHQKNYALLELLGQQLGNANLSYNLRQILINQFNLANSCIAPITLQAMGRVYKVVFAQSASAFRAKYIPGTEPHVWELQVILQARSDLVNGTFGG